MVAYVTRRLFTGELPAGIHYIDELPALACLPGELSHDTTLWTPQALHVMTQFRPAIEEVKI
jgi:hypothetical protein